MKVEIYNTYHDTTKVVEVHSLEEAIQNEEALLNITADWLSINEVEEDWELYYNSFEDALDATYIGIYEQLTSEIEYKILGEE